MPDLWTPIAQQFLLVAGACLLGAIALRPWRAPRPESTALARRCLAILLVGGAGFLIAKLGNVTEAMVLVGVVGAAVALIAPDVLGAVLRQMPGREPRLRLGKRQLQHNRARNAAAVVILTTALGAPLALLTLLHTDLATQEASFVPAASPHQVVLSGVRSVEDAPPAEAVRAVRRQVAFAEPAIQTYFLAGGADGRLLAVDTPEEAGRLGNRSLNAEEAGTLSGGGLLIWSGDVRAEPLRAIRSQFDPTWRTDVRGVLLTSTARALNVPMTAGAVVFTGVPDGDAGAAQRAILDARMDYGLIRIHQPPEPASAPFAFVAAVLGLAVIALLTTTVVARAQAGALRGHLSALFAIGLPARWARQVLLIETAVVVGIGALLATAVAVSSIAVAAWRIDSLVLSVPWADIGILLATVCFAAFAAASLASRRLLAADRHRA